MKAIDNLREEYPNVIRLIPNVDESERIEIDINYILTMLKAKKYEKDEKGKHVDFIEFEGKRYHFDVDKLKTVIDILGTTELKVYLKRRYCHAFYFMDNAENSAFLMGIIKN